MTEAETFYTTTEVAELVGVSQRRVQQMLDEGELVRVARGLVSAASVDRHLAAHPRRRGRAWDERTAWAAVALLDGVDVDWLGAAQVSRLRAALRGTTASADLVARTRNRAAVHVFEGHPAAIGRLAEELVVADRTRLGLTADLSGRLDGYLDAAALAAVATSLGLQQDPGGAVVVRATSIDLGLVARLAEGSVLPALDAATAVDPRERGVGHQELTRVLATGPR